MISFIFLRFDAWIGVFFLSFFHRIFLDSQWKKIWDFCNMFLDEIEVFMCGWPFGLSWSLCDWLIWYSILICSKYGCQRSYFGEAHLLTVQHTSWVFVFRVYGGTGIAELLDGKEQSVWMLMTLTGFTCCFNKLE